MDIQKAIEEINANINSITDPVAKAIISQLLNIIEALTQENKVLKAENQKLLDENNKLKGGNSKPNIRQQSKKNLSSEKERNKKKKKNKKSKKTKVHPFIRTVNSVFKETVIFINYLKISPTNILAG